MEIVFRLAALRRGLALAVAALVWCGFWAEVWDDVFGLADPYELVPFFGLSYEANLPTWFASLMLAACGALLALIALATRQARGRYLAHWGLLAVVFFYISLDEFVRLHEEMNDWFDFEGVLYFGWVIPAGIACAIFALSYLGFLAHLPLRIRNRFVLAGALYVGGALGVELLLGWWTSRAGDDNFVYAMIDLLEESLELTGVCVFFTALVEHLMGSGEGVRIAPRPSVEGSA